MSVSVARVVINDVCCATRPVCRTNCGRDKVNRSELWSFLGALKERHRLAMNEHETQSVRQLLAMNILIHSHRVNRSDEKLLASSNQTAKWVGKVNGSLIKDSSGHCAWSINLFFLQLVRNGALLRTPIQATVL